ncbi:MAG: hypothetical protein LBH47_00805 [Christensenellaceae bacterium]|jgi:hypothetical protein|nr:hypothetical protein [Christensenellaceae bacterium]
MSGLVLNVSNLIAFAATKTSHVLGFLCETNQSLRVTAGRDRPPLD